MAEIGLGLHPWFEAEGERVTIFKLGDESEGVVSLWERLLKYGYEIWEVENPKIYDKQLAYAARAFNFHFNQKKSKNWGDWDSHADQYLDDLISQLPSLDPIIKVETPINFTYVNDISYIPGIGVYWSAP